MKRPRRCVVATLRPPAILRLRLPSERPARAPLALAQRTGRPRLRQSLRLPSFTSFYVHKHGLKIFGRSAIDLTGAITKTTS